MHNRLNTLDRFFEQQDETVRDIEVIDDSDAEAESHTNTHTQHVEESINNNMSNSNNNNNNKNNNNKRGRNLTKATYAINASDHEIVQLKKNLAAKAFAKGAWCDLFFRENGACFLCGMNRNNRGFPKTGNAHRNHCINRHHIERMVQLDIMDYDHYQAMQHSTIPTLTAFTARESIPEDKKLLSLFGLSVQCMLDHGLPY